MPNWCFNELTISGEKAKVVRFLEGLKAVPAAYNGEVETKPCYTLNSYVPVPQEVQQGPYSPTYGEHVLSPLTQVCGYNWQIENWGSKWDCMATEEFEAEMTHAFSNLEVQPEDHVEVSLQFETAWSPISQWVETVGQQFSDLVFTLHYCEEGMGFGGVTEVIDGNVDERYYEDHRIYQLAEGRTDLSDIIEDIYFSAIEYELEVQELNKLPDASDEVGMKAWEEQVSEIVEEQIDCYLSEVIKEGYLDSKVVFDAMMKQIKDCLAA